MGPAWTLGGEKLAPVGNRITTHRSPSPQLHHLGSKLFVLHPTVLYTPESVTYSQRYTEKFHHLVNYSNVSYCHKLTALTKCKITMLSKYMNVRPQVSHISVPFSLTFQHQTDLHVPILRISRDIHKYISNVRICGHNRICNEYCAGEKRQGGTRPTKYRFPALCK